MEYRHYNYLKKTTSQVIVLNGANMTVEKVTFCRAIFMSNLYYGDLDKCVKNVLSQAPPLLEQKTTICINLAEIMANFTNFDSV